VKSLDEITCVILAGGRGTRLGTAYDSIPKPLVRIGPYPILMHIISIYYRSGVRKFLVCTGFKSHSFSEYFDSITRSKAGDSYVLRPQMCPELFPNYTWAEGRSDFFVELLDTGIESTTANRVRQAMERISTRQFFCTYGDGVAKIDIRKLFNFHFTEDFEITISAFHPPSRFGELVLDKSGRVLSFKEKQLSSVLVNGGFLVMNSNLHHKIDINLSLEEGLLSSCAQEGKLGAYVSNDFWQMMDTPREVELLQNRFLKSDAPWLES
jgi:glucose-1-phosphate cytidylyltransferase